MHGEDLSDDTYVAAAPRDVAAVTGDPARWAAWWPDLTLTVTRDRGPQGVQWEVAGALRGTAEIWLEPAADGTVVHFYLRAAMGARDRRRRELGWKRSVYAVKDALEHGRKAGTPVRRSSP